MKQYISEKQFNKLPDKAQKSLSQGGYSRLYIGQLIEFLAERKNDIHIERFDGGKKHSYWNVSTCYDKGWEFGKEQKELCDVLWEAVKMELEIKRKGYIGDRQKLFKSKSVASLYKDAKKFNRK